MSLERGEWNDILEVLRETHKIWSAGLTVDRYLEYISFQLRHSWARRNFCYLMLRNDAGKLAASCKLYSISLQSRGKQYQLYGLGAVYTMKQFRGQGYATKLIEEVIDLAHLKGKDGILLFSDIGPGLYADLGFTEMGGAEFSIQVPRGAVSEDGRLLALARVQPVDISMVPSMVRHYRRWLSRTPFGFARSEEYWRFKLKREAFLHKHSRLSWPQLQIVHWDLDSSDGGYALIETGGPVIRVLEVIGSDETRKKLWNVLTTLTVHLLCSRLRGWEGNVSDFAPGFTLRGLEPDVTFNAGSPPLQLTYRERDWGRPMLLVITPEIQEWFEYFPNPLLELDHL